MSKTDFPATLEQRIAELEKARNVLLSETSDGIDKKPSFGWSISEIIHHLYIVEKGITGMITKALEAKEHKTRKTDDELFKEWQQVTSFVVSRERRIEAPSMVIPQTQLELSQGLKLLEQSRAALHKFLQNTTIDELASVSMPHPLKDLGLISGAGWLSLIACHELRHIEQIKEIKQQNN